MPPMERLLDRTLRALAAGLRSREFSAMDLWREARAAMDASEPRLNAYKLRMDAFAEKAALAADEALAAGLDLGTLQGIPVSVKDLYGVPGFPTFAGAARELPSRWQAAGPLVRGLLDSKAVITGKTHTVEFAFGGVGRNNHWPTPRNPWDPKHHRVPGGSSSGAGVSLRQGSAIVALGSDTAGSVRLPASLTGNVGYKPTIGRWSTEGIVPLSRLFDTPGILARSVDDAYLAAIDFDRRMHGERAGAIGTASVERLTIGVPGGHFWDACEPSIEVAVRAALARLEMAGHRLVSFDWVEAAEALELWNSGGTAGAELRLFLEVELPDWIPILDPNVGLRMQTLAGVTAMEVQGRKAAFDAIALRSRRWFDELDVVATPTVQVPPPRMDEVDNHDGYRAHNMRLLRNTHTANLLGLCGITLPVGLDSLGLPVGLQLMAGGMRDDRLFAAALACEKALSA
jgi:aspartyl-tRNA(Asn)/glutamyl-tRNA(Gln) amidotransferase subunit A